MGSGQVWEGVRRVKEMLSCGEARIGWLRKERG